MDPKDAEFLRKLQATFRVEAREHLRSISVGLLELEKTPDPARRAELVETVFRETHSLKGAARAVDQRGIEAVCQPMESTLSVLKRNQIVLTPVLCDLLHQAVDHIARLLDSPSQEPALPDQERLRELTARLRQAALESTPPGQPAATSPAPPSPPPSPAPQALGEAAVSRPSPRTRGDEPPALGETVRIPTAKLEPLLLQAEEMLMAKLAAAQRAIDARGACQEVMDWLEALRPRPERRPEERSLAGDEARLHALRLRLDGLVASLAEDHRAVKRLVDEHLEAMKGLLMLPAASIMDLLPRLVRDLARGQGKEVELTVQGGEIEMDKRVLEEFKAPLIHLIRNCVDHGLQKPEERLRQGKPRQGRIHLTISPKDGRQVEIVLSDDGVGIDLEKVRAAAVSKEIVSAEAASRLDPEQTLALIFQSGLSTSPIITDISGRGLGLAIVRERVEGLGGTVTLDSHGQAGATFRIALPLTRAAFSGILARVGEHQFLLPTINVERALRVPRAEIKAVESHRTVAVDGRVLALVDLAHVLGLPRPPAPSPQAEGRGTEALAGDWVLALVLRSADQRMAFQVDEVLDEQQVLLKSLGRQLRRVRNLSGAAVLGSGRVVPVLNPPDLMLSAIRPVPETLAAEGSPEPARAERILVVEDSITSRTLIKGILESAGYQVATAVDGMDAISQLRGGRFDLVVSDVDMPRLNGFELTARIRADDALRELPVVLVTALGSREDRERGVEVGANAYIVKSSFDQSNLLDVLTQLL